MKDDLEKEESNMYNGEMWAQADDQVCDECPCTQESPVQQLSLLTPSQSLHTTCTLQLERGAY